LTVDIQLPVVDCSDPLTSIDVHPDEELLVDSFTPSVTGRLFKV